MSKLKLHAPVFSTCGQRCLVILEETGIDYELVNVDFVGGEHKTKEFIEKYQPFGRVPALSDGDLIIFESRAIIRYIASLANSDLFPKDLKQRALVDTWLCAEASEFAAMERLIAEVLFKKMFRNEEPDEAEVKKHEDAVNNFFTVFDKHLGKNKYAAGDNISIADFSFLPYLRLAYDIPKYKELIEKYQNVHKWYTELSQRKSWQKVISML